MIISANELTLDLPLLDVLSMRISVVKCANSPGDKDVWMSARR
jgi:hypothetical protein